MIYSLAFLNLLIEACTRLQEVIILLYSLFAEAHPLYLGCCALSAKDYEHVCIEKADLIIMVGHDVVEKPPFIMQ